MQSTQSTLFVQFGAKLFFPRKSSPQPCKNFYAVWLKHQNEEPKCLSVSAIERANLKKLTSR